MTLITPITIPRAIFATAAAARPSITPQPAATAAPVWADTVYSNTAAPANDPTNAPIKDPITGANTHHRADQSADQRAPSRALRGAVSAFLRTGHYSHPRLDAVKRGTAIGVKTDIMRVSGSYAGAGVQRFITRGIIERLFWMAASLDGWSRALRSRSTRAPTRHVYDPQGPGERRSVGVPQVLILDRTRRAFTVGTADDGSWP
jgi:hypothetical protein